MSALSVHDSLLELITRIEPDKFTEFLKANQDYNMFLEGYYIYTLPEYKTFIIQELLRFPGKTFAAKYNDYILAVNQYFQDKIKREYTPRISRVLSSISQHKPIEQKSPEWLAKRKNLIAASEAGYMLGIAGASRITTYMKNKCNLATSLESLQYVNSIIHGITYEPVSRIIYESRNNATITEYGLITTSKCGFIGASPDGITTAADDPSKIGRLVEIKNPYTWKDKTPIKPEYLIQIYQQQYVLDIPVCDFVRTHIIGPDHNPNAEAEGFKPYHTIDDMLNDTWKSDSQKDIKCLIPPHRASSLGMEKGVLIKITLKSGISSGSSGKALPDTASFIYPFDKPYNKPEILEWIDNTVSHVADKYNIDVKYWYVAGYYQKTYIYNKSLYETYYLPRLDCIWKLIEHIRKLPNTINSINHYIDNIIKPELAKPVAFYKNHIENHKTICELYENLIKKCVPITEDDKPVTSDDKPVKAMDKAMDKVISKIYKSRKNAVEIDF